MLKYALTLPRIKFPDSAFITTELSGKIPLFKLPLSIKNSVLLSNLYQINGLIIFELLSFNIGYVYDVIAVGNVFIDIEPFANVILLVPELK